MNIFRGNFAYQELWLKRFLGVPALSLFLLLAFSPGARAALNGEVTETMHAPTGDVILTIPAGSLRNEMIIQILVPDMRVTERIANGRRFQQLNARGYGYTSEIGKPRMPVKGFYLAVPGGAALEIEVLDTDSFIRGGYCIFPVPEPAVRETESGEPAVIEKFVLDATAYASPRYYPDRLVEVGDYGYLRELRVVQFRIFPVQYNPRSGEARFHRRIRLRARLIGGAFPPIDNAREVEQEKRDPFDAVYRGLVLNYSRELRTDGGWGGMTIPSAVDLEYLDNDPYKVSVKEDGIYEIGHADLVAAGADPGMIDPAAIRMFNLGEEIAIDVAGAEDGSFDENDCIIFLGVGNDSEYSDTNVYWISWGGDEGLRMERVDCAPGDSLPVPEAFLQKSHFEENKYYFSNFSDENADRWFWDQLIAPYTEYYAMQLPGVSTVATDAVITISLRGRTDVNHSTGIFINDYHIADAFWNDRNECRNVVNYPQSYLNDGFNMLKLMSANSPQDQSYLNWVDIEYHRLYEARNDLLRFSDCHAGPNQFEVAGFTDSEIALYRITNHVLPKRLVAVSIEAEESTYRLTFQDSLDGQEYIALCPSGRTRPVSLTRDNASRLRSPGQGADYIIITHENFYESIQPLVTLRESEGLGVTIVLIDNVYDEFSFGNFNPEAIKNFLRYAYDTWPQPAPSYVLLVGDASRDYKGYLSSMNANYVPTHTFLSHVSFSGDLVHMEIPSDDWFVYLAGDDLLADMCIGRLSGRSESDIAAQVEKICAYEKDLSGGGWRKSILLVADNSDAGGDFEGICDNLADNHIVPAGYDVEKCYVSQCGSGCRQQIVDGMDAGCVICNYVGHGTIKQWAHERIFESSDIAALSNESTFPLVIAFTCLNGLFDHMARSYCLSEEFMRPAGRGAIACWSHSGYGYASSSELIGEHFYDVCFNENRYSLGSSVFTTKGRCMATLPDHEQQLMMLVLLGDPALEMGFPAQPDILPAKLRFNPPRPFAGEGDTITVKVFNAGRSAASDILIRFYSGHPDSMGSAMIADATIFHIGAGEQSAASALWDSVPSPGAHSVFVTVDPEDWISESNEWNNVTWDTMRVLSPGDVQDTIPPSVELYIDDKKVGVDFQNNDYTSPTPRVSALFSDDESGINVHDIRVTLNGASVQDVTVEPEENGSAIVALGFHSQPLHDGLYTLSMQASDCCPCPNVTSASVTFVIESALVIRRISTYPNPCRNSTSIFYYLSRDAEDVKIRIYDIAGRLVRTIRAAPRYQNANVFNWDCKNDSGHSMASGMYFYSIIAMNRKEKICGSGKLIIVK